MSWKIPKTKTGTPCQNCQRAGPPGCRAHQTTRKIKTTPGPGRRSVVTQKGPAFIAAIRDGHTTRDAASIAGIDQATPHRWRERADPTHPNHHAAYSDFSEQWAEAERYLVTASLAVVRKNLAAGNLQAAKMVLQAKRADAWASAEAHLVLHNPPDSKEYGFDPDDVLPDAEE